MLLQQLLLIGLMWLPNQVVFIQFHPVVYITKLNIEMSMASLVVKLALGKSDVRLGDMYDPESEPRSMRLSHHHAPSSLPSDTLTPKRTEKEDDDSVNSVRGIHCRTDLNVTVETVSVKDVHDAHNSTDSGATSRDMFGDTIPLNDNRYHAHEGLGSN